MLAVVAATKSFWRSAAVLEVRASTVEAALPLMLFTAGCRYPPCFLRSQA